MASVCSTMRSTRPWASRTTRPKPGRVVELGGEQRARRRRPRGARWRGGPASRAAASGVSPGMTITSSSSSRSSAKAVSADAGGVAGAALHALLDELDRDVGRELLLQRLGDALGAVADDDHDPLERQRAERVDARAAASAARTAGAAPWASPSACGCPRPPRARPPPAVGSGSCAALLASPVLAGPGARLGGEVSNLDLGLQRTPCCRYTTPEGPDRPYPPGYSRSCAECDGVPRPRHG